MVNANDANDIYLSGYLHIFAITLLYYDHFITMGREVKYLWRRPKRPSTYWFFLHRYFSFFMNIMMTLFKFTISDPKVCRPPSPSIRNDSKPFLELQTILSGTPAAPRHKSSPLIMTLRIYALYGRSPRVIGALVVVGGILISVSCWALFGQKGAPAPQASGCQIGLSYRTSIHLAAAWEALFVYDSIIFALTLAKTWREGRNVAIHKRLPVATLFLRDGAIYFAVMVLANLANVLTFYFCGTFLRGGLSTFSSSISVTMMSRFMLNLHETASVGIFSTQITTQDYLSRLEFFGT
ncbi:hypothetical protein BD779DRAFT_1671400 [Infundibulicybe gibba]|nr:hypothetical protein BD779DRAFT_1671400 [Infundibulicybe gibba]